jgi:HAD superfamily hydrolase (TIGR01509 family)
MGLPALDQIECLVFDLFGEIVSFDDRLVYDRIAQRCAAPDRAAHQMLDLVSEPNLIRGRTSLEQLHERLVVEFGLNASLKEFTNMWIASYSEPMPGIRLLLRHLVGHCRLVLLSNVDRYYWPTVRASIPELRDFHAQVLSFEQGVAKPEAEAFNRAVQAGGVGIQRCYFVDDKHENVDAAASHGLAGHVFRSTASLKLALRQAGLRLV